MNSILNGVMLFLFVLFMIFIFGGYHITKSAQREKQFERERERKEKEDKENA